MNLVVFVMKNFEKILQNLIVSFRGKLILDFAFKEARSSHFRPERRWTEV